MLLPPFWCSGGEQSSVERLGDRGSAITDAELGVNVQQVGLHRGLGDEQPGRGFPVGIQKEPFASTECRKWCGPCQPRNIAPWHASPDLMGRRLNRWIDQTTEPIHRPADW